MAGRRVALVDNLFSACELAAKATLLSMPDPTLPKLKHKGLHSKVNLWASHGSIVAAHRKAFNRLFEVRFQVRYLKKNDVLSEVEAEQLLTTVEEMIANAEGRHAH